MIIAPIISAIGNNSSVYPLLVRDCGIENPIKVVLTYKQNKEDKEVAKLATRERLIDEYATSAVWLGGIPLIGFIADFIIKKKGFNPNINPKLFEENKLQGLKYNIEKFKQTAPEAVQDLMKLTNPENQKYYKKLLSIKFLASTIIPIAFMGFILPKMIFASSARRIEKLKKERETANKSMPAPVMRPNFTGVKREVLDNFTSNKSKQVAFTGFSLAKLATVSTQDKMMITDGGYTVGRVVTARKKNEAIDVGFRLSGMMFLNFIAPKWIEKFLDKVSGVDLDPIMLADKNFARKVKSGGIKLPVNDAPETLLKFVDENPDSMFVKFANKFKKVKMLDNGIRDPRAYINFEDLGKFRNAIAEFIEKAPAGKNFDKYIRKAKILKATNILANVGISSYLLAYALPKATFAFRKLVTGSNLEPGLAPDVQAAEKINQQAK